MSILSEQFDFIDKTRVNRINDGSRNKFYSAGEVSANEVET